MRPSREAERIAAHRRKIAEGGVLDLLIAHVHGEIELSQARIASAFALLRKILPDFSTSPAPMGGEESPEAEDDDSPVPAFEFHIVDPQEN
jgi:hypothetical protein